MTFAEELTVKADVFEMNIDIAEHIDYLKCQFDKYYTKREYCVSLVKPTNGSVAIGNASNNCSLFLIPKRVRPERYVALFVSELIKLGFNMEQLQLTSRSYKNHDCYDIIVRW